MGGEGRIRTGLTNSLATGYKKSIHTKNKKTQTNKKKTIVLERTLPLFNTTGIHGTDDVKQTR